MKLSVNQTVILIAALVALVVMTALHDVGGNVVVPVIAAIAANALGYVNGKKVARGELRDEVRKHVEQTVAADAAIAAGAAAAAVGEPPVQPATTPPAVTV